MVSWLSDMILMSVMVLIDVKLDTLSNSMNLLKSSVTKYLVWVLTQPRNLRTIRCIVRLYEICFKTFLSSIQLRYERSQLCLSP